jgi:hypothetical protein
LPVRVLSFALHSTEFFQDAGEVVEVRLATKDDGSSKGFGHVDFATEEAAAKVSSFGVSSGILFLFLIGIQL